MATNRLIGDYPVIGIRPTIDGRRGVLKVRESLEEQTMGMAKAAAKLFTENLKYSNGEPVKVVIADTTIGRVPESAACAEKFKKEGVDITLTVTPCWCYGSETMDMDPKTIKGVWGFNGTERPGAVYLASVLASHAQKGLPAFGIYGHDVQNADATEIPEDVQEKLLRFGRAAVAVATMRGKSYLQIGSICMGIAGSIISTEFFEEYLGMRVESVDEVEIIRRMTEGIYDHAEFEKALKWTKENCKQGFDKNPDFCRKTDAEKEEAWEFVVKMMCIIKDLYNGNKNLPEGCEEEQLGHNAIAGGFQGQRQWTDFYPNCDFPEAMMNSSFDWNGAREPWRNRLVPAQRRHTRGAYINAMTSPPKPPQTRGPAQKVPLVGGARNCYNERAAWLCHLRGVYATLLDRPGVCTTGRLPQLFCCFPAFIIRDMLPKCNWCSKFCWDERGALAGRLFCALPFWGEGRISGRVDGGAVLRGAAPDAGVRDSSALRASE